MTRSSLINKAIKREHVQLPTFEDMAFRVSTTTVFSKLDTVHGYWQIPLDEWSQVLITVNIYTSFGRYCFTRLPFGIKSAQKVFRKRVSPHFDEIESMATDIDDILIWRFDEHEHDRRLKATLQECEETNLILNEGKCKFKVEDVFYCGHNFTKHGVRPDESKIKVIQEMQLPFQRKMSKGC